MGYIDDYRGNLPDCADHKTITRLRADVMRLQARHDELAHEVSDESFARIVKRYEDAGDAANADVIRAQWAAAKATRPAHMEQIKEAAGQELDALRKLAEAATPGPWEYDAPENMILDVTFKRLIAQPRSTELGKEARDANGPFIAAANPAVVLALLDTIASQRQVIAGGVPDGSWLWAKLMDWCKLRGVAPSNYDDLFSIAAAAHAANAARESALLAEIWAAADGNPDVKPDKEMLLAALRAAAPVAPHQESAA